MDVNVMVSIWLGRKNLSITYKPSVMEFIHRNSTTQNSFITFIIFLLNTILLSERKTQTLWFLHEPVFSKQEGKGHSRAIT